MAPTGLPSSRQLISEGWTDIGGNVTVDPAERASPAHNLQVTKILNTRAGSSIDARRFIRSLRYDRLIQFRNLIKEMIKRENPRVACFLCGTPVYLVARRNKRFFFRHTIEDGSCRARTKDRLTREQIQALKYQGNCESEAHRKVKARIERSLQADPEFSSIGTELTWKSIQQPGGRRRPDVSAEFRGIRIAFEAQLSTTFLDVVVGRRMFYKDEGGLLVWVLQDLDPEYRRLTDDDMLFTNNSNIVVVDEESTVASEAEGRFIVRCHYREPFFEDGTRKEAWRSCLVPFSEFVLDRDNQRAFWFDFDAAEALVTEKLAEISAQRQREEEAQRLKKWADREAATRDQVYEFVTEFGQEYPPSDYALEVWDSLRDRLDGHGVSSPESFWGSGNFRVAVFMILSAKNHRPIGWHFEKLVQVAHRVLDHHKDLFRLFNVALKVYDANGVIAGEDGTRKWAAKVQRLTPAIKEMAKEYRSDRTWLPTLTFLFPELSDQLGGSSR